MSTLIKNGRIITAVDDYYADVFVEGESIALIGRDLQVEADRVIDATGKLVIPGGIDPHTHMDMPFGGTTSADDFESGTKAAAFGGTTTIVDFAIQTKGESTLKGLDTWHQKAAGKATIDYAFHMIVTDMPDERLPEMRRLADEGVTSYKLFMAYPGVLYVDDGTLYRAFRQAGENGTRICMHAENGIVIDEIIKRAVADGHTEPRWHAKTRPTRMEAEGVHRPSPSRRWPRSRSTSSTCRRRTRWTRSSARGPAASTSWPRPARSICSWTRPSTIAPTSRAPSG
jgi:dihydropyrimidinase